MLRHQASRVPQSPSSVRGGPPHGASKQCVHSKTYFLTGLSHKASLITRGLQTGHLGAFRKRTASVVSGLSMFTSLQQKLPLCVTVPWWHSLTASEILTSRCIWTNISDVVPFP